MPFPKLLDGIRVLDCSRVLAGPFCSQMLGDLGAEVIKIERPGVGDETRQWGPPFHPTGPSAYYLSCNRNKLGVSLDLAAPEGRELFDEMVRRSDVVLENLLPDSAAKLGLSPDRLHAVNPRLIVCSISGYGRTGPMASEPGYDFAIQALSGLMSITGPADGEPSKVGVAMTDLVTGQYACAAILAALVARGRTGKGYVIDVALLDCAVAAQVNVIQAYLARRDGGLSATESDPVRQGNAHAQIVPYELFPTADGWVVVAVGNDGQWRRFAPLLGQEFASEARYATNPERVRLRGELVPKMKARMCERTTADWLTALTDAKIPHAALQTYSRLFDMPQIDARGMRVTVRDNEGRDVSLVGNPMRVREAGDEGGAAEMRMPPDQGEHTAEVLARLCGVGGDRLRDLERKGIISRTERE